MRPSLQSIKNSDQHLCSINRLFHPRRERQQRNQRQGLRSIQFLSIRAYLNHYKMQLVNREQAVQHCWSCHVAIAAPCERRRACESARECSHPPDRWITCTERALVGFLPQWRSCPAQHASCISQACWCARMLAGVGFVSCTSMSIRRWSLVVR